MLRANTFLLNFGFTGKLGLLLAIASVVLAMIPAIQYEKKSAGGKLLDDVKDSFSKLERHAFDESRFRFSMEGDAKWSSLAMICAVAALALGLVSLATELFSSALAILLAIAVGVWMFFGR